MKPPRRSRDSGRLLLLVVAEPVFAEEPIVYDGPGLVRAHVSPLVGFHGLVDRHNVLPRLLRRAGSR